MEGLITMEDGNIEFSSLGALIIDDNDFVRFMLEKHLSGFGFKKIYQAEDGFAGLNVLQQKMPDIIICDINMKPVNGFEFLKRVRNMETSVRDIPIIFLTSNADESFVKRAIDLKVDAYLLKPVMPTFLKTHILKIMEEKMTA